MESKPCSGMLWGKPQQALLKHPALHDRGQTSASEKKWFMTPLKTAFKMLTCGEVYGKPAEAEHAAGQQWLWACARAGGWEQSLQLQCWFVSCWEGAVLDTGNGCGQLEEASGNCFPFFYLWTTLDWKKGYKNIAVNSLQTIKMGWKYPVTEKKSKTHIQKNYTAILLLQVIS